VLDTIGILLPPRNCYFKDTDKRVRFVWLARTVGVSAACMHLARAATYRVKTLKISQAMALDAMRLVLFDGVYREELGEDDLDLILTCISSILEALYHHRIKRPFRAQLDHTAPAGTDDWREKRRRHDPRVRLNTLASNSMQLLWNVEDAKEELRVPCLGHEWAAILSPSPSLFVCTRCAMEIPSEQQTIYPPVHSCSGCGATYCSHACKVLLFFLISASACLCLFLEVFFFQQFFR
jgi:hypothetical protein